MWQASEQVKHRAQCSIDMRRGWRNVQLFSGVKSFRMPLKNWLTRRSSSSLDAGFGRVRAIVSSRTSYFFLAWSECGAMTGSSPGLSYWGGSGRGPGYRLGQHFVDSRLLLPPAEVRRVVPADGVVGEVLAHEVRHVRERYVRHQQAQQDQRGLRQEALQARAGQGSPLERHEGVGKGTGIREVPDHPG